MDVEKTFTCSNQPLPLQLMMMVLMAALWSPCGCGGGGGGGGGGCPPDTAARVQQCVANLSWGVAPAAVDDNGYGDINGHPQTPDGDDSYDISGSLHQGQGQGQGSAAGSRSSSRSGSWSSSRSERMLDSAAGPTIPLLDYRKIREYCAEDGHMLRFVQCVEELSQHCPDVPPDGAFGQLINPLRVRTSVPRLCSHEDVIEERSECMNMVVSEGGGECRDRAHTAITSLPVPPHPPSSPHPHNVTGESSLFLQCRYFNVLAGCQKTEMSRACGGQLGELHADFLLSFLPNLCSSSSSPPGSPSSSSSGSPPRALPEDLRDPDGLRRKGPPAGLTDVTKKEQDHLSLHHRSNHHHLPSSSTKTHGKSEAPNGGGNSGEDGRSENRSLGMSGWREEVGMESSNLGGSSERTPNYFWPGDPHDRSPGGIELSSSEENVSQHATTKQAPQLPSSSSVPSTSELYGPANGTATQEVTSAQEVTTQEVEGSIESHITCSSPPGPRKTSVAAATVETSLLALSLIVCLGLFF